MKQNYPCRILFLSLIFGLPGGLAQTVPAAPTSAKEDAVVLNPFLVTSSTDAGYAATNTLDGSRLNTALRDTPAAISVFTKDFLDDIGATDISSLLRYDLST